MVARHFTWNLKTKIELLGTALEVFGLYPGVTGVYGELPQ
jgi:hypothetical protein